MSKKEQKLKKNLYQRNCWTSEITTMSTKPTGKNHRPEKSW